MGHEQNRLLFAFPDSEQDFVHIDLGVGIERAERFVHQQYLRLDHQRPHQRRALAHAAGQCRWIGRLEAAKKAGAKATYNSKDPANAKKLMADTGGAFAVVDFVGSESSFAFANSIVRKGGKIIIVGLFGGAMGMPLPMFPLRALSIVGSFVGSLPEAEEMMEIVRAGKVDPIPYTERPLAQAGQTLSDLRAGKITGRVVLTP